MNHNFNEIKHTFTEEEKSNRKGKKFGLNTRSKNELSKLTKIFAGRTLEDFKAYCRQEGKSFHYLKKYSELLKDVLSTHKVVQQAPLEIVDKNTLLLEQLICIVQEQFKRIEELTKKVDNLSKSSEKVSLYEENINKEDILPSSSAKDLKSLFNSEGWKAKKSNNKAVLDKFWK